RRTQAVVGRQIQGVQGHGTGQDADRGPHPGEERALVREAEPRVRLVAARVDPLGSSVGHGTIMPADSAARRRPNGTARATTPPPRGETASSGSGGSGLF